MNERELFAALDEAALDGCPTVSALYRAAGQGLLQKAAKGLCNALKNGRHIFIITGFILAPFNKPETDGLVSSVLLAKTLENAFGAKSAFICPHECAAVLGEMLKSIGVSAIVEIIGKEKAAAVLEAEQLIEKYEPCAAVAIECPSADSEGVYHNAAGLDITALESKCDIALYLCRDKGIFNIAIGDRGNEAGMGGIAHAVRENVAHGSIISAAGKADNLLLGRASDLAGYALAASVCFLTDTELFTQKEHSRVLETAVKFGAIDMSGRAIAAVDGISESELLAIAEKMRSAIKKAHRR